MADIEGEQELRDSGGEENARDAVAPQGAPRHAPVQIRTILDVVQARIVQ